MNTEQSKTNNSDKAQDKSKPRKDNTTAQSRKQDNDRDIAGFIAKYLR